MSDFDIRPATAADHEAIWRCLEPVIRAGETYALPRDMPRSQALTYWLGNDRQAFVAERNGDIVGTYYLRSNLAGGGAHVCNCAFVTAAAAQGQGIARAMCRHAMDVARAQRFRAMQFNFVIASNTRAVALWQSLGFQMAGRLPQAFAHPTLGFVDALAMHPAL